MVSFNSALVAAVFALAACAQNTATRAADVAAAAATAKTDHSTSQVAGKAFDRIAIIWLENTDYDKAAGDPNLAFLAKKGITLTNYNAVTHPSEPNYVAAIGGDNFGMDNDNFNFIAQNVSTVIDLLESKGISWGFYQEDMPYSGFQGYNWVNQKTGANDYVRKHNPGILYDADSTPDRLAKNKNLTEFFVDLENETLPQWFFITPNMTSDGHDTSVTTAGTWTRNFLEPLLDDSRFMNNTLVLVTFDENHTYTIRNTVFSFLLGDAVPANLVGTTDDSYYNHYSEISTVEANWDLPTLGRWDVGANVFDLVGQKTGDEIREWASPSYTDCFFNQSFSGPFSAAHQMRYPVPNIDLVFNCREVASWIQETYSDATPDYYTDKLEIPDGLRAPAGWAIPA